MAVSILLVTHNNLGQSLLDTVITTLGTAPALSVQAIAVRYDTDPERLLPRLKEVLASCDQGDGVLVLTDMFGSTPSNLSQALKGEGSGVRVVAGLNLPMLIRVLNYPKLSLEELVEKACSGGREGVLDCEKEI